MTLTDRLKLKLTSLNSTKESSISLALIRIFMVIIAWATWARGLRLFETVHFSQELLIVSIPFFISSIFVFLGLHFNLWKWIYSGSLFALYFYIGWFRDVTFYTHHHSYLICIASIFMCTGNAAGSLSFDSLKLSDEQKQTEPWARLLICLQISSMYFWTAVDKLSFEFLSGERLQQIFALRLLKSSLPHLSSYDAIASLMAISVVLFEFILSFGLWSKTLRKYLILLGIIFHLSLYVLLPVGTFSVAVILLYLAFIPPKDIESFIKKSIHE